MTEHFGYTKDRILAENDIEFSSVDDMYNKHEELNLGDIMSDAYVYAVENSEYYVLSAPRRIVL